MWLSRGRVFQAEGKVQRPWGELTSGFFKGEKRGADADLMVVCVCVFSQLIIKAKSACG